MSNLGPQTVKNSYDGLLQIPGGVTSALQPVQDGSGNLTGLWLSSTGANVTTSDEFIASNNGSQISQAVSRLISDGFGDYVSVKDFGAIGDGITDDTIAFQNAVISGAPVYVPYTSSFYVLTSLSQIGINLLFGPGNVQISGVKYAIKASVPYGNYVTAGQVANVNGYGKGGFNIGGGTPTSPNGMWLSMDGAANWLVAQVGKNENPTESILYSTSGQGYAVSVVGTNQIARLWGSPFQARWEGNTIYFLRKKFQVVSVISADSLIVSELDGSPVTFGSAVTEAYNYFYTSGSGTCNVNGTTVTFVSGDPFIPTFGTGFQLKINGSVVAVASFNSVTQYTLSASLGTLTNVSFAWQTNINDQLTTIRVQAIQGENEENFNLMSIAGDNFLGRYYAMNTGLAGTYGQFRPIYIGSGAYTDNSYMYLIGCYPRNLNGAISQGYVSLGGVQGREGLRVYTPNASTVLANYISIQGAPSGTSAAIRSQGSDANIAFSVDAKGSGSFNVTQDFARNLFQAQGTTSAVNWLTAIASSTGFAPTFKVQGSDTNIAFGVDTKGSGEFRITQDFSRTLFKAQGATNAVNWLTTQASISGSPTIISVDTSSSDANVDIRLQPKGTGAVAIGNVTANADAPITGYVRVKDYSGNVVKLAVIA